MADKLVLITGGGSGIGRATALHLARQGYDIAVLGRQRENLAETVRACETVKARAFGVTADVRKRDELEKAIVPLGSLKALVVNAGVCRRARLDDPAAGEVWRDVLAANLDGSFYTLELASKQLVDGGRIVAVSSGLGKLGRAGYSAYTASKHALLGIVKCLAKELAARRITVNAVCPGWVETEMARADLKNTAKEKGITVEQARAEAEKGIALNRFVAPEEVAALIGFLISDQAGAITGEAYNISCGEFTA